MVDVGDDAEVADVIKLHGRLNERKKPNAATAAERV
jgi:hypothetical protein